VARDRYDVLDNGMPFLNALMAKHGLG
jgi:hypothetical protein